MTTPATAFVPTGNPVRRFVLAIAVVALLCLALWWSAVLAPRLILFVEETNLVTRAGVLSVTNDGPMTVEVEGVRIGPGDTARIDVVVPEDCDAPVRVQARTAVGLTRTVETDGPVACSR